MQLSAKASPIPVKEWSGHTTDLPLVFYVSGDGGFNHFTLSLCDSISKCGYDVLALDARTYFWQKKKVNDAAKDLGDLIAAKLHNRKNRTVICIGYSFGADVLPFLINEWKSVMQPEKVVLIAPSGSTDFEIHWSDIMGSYTEREMKVPDACNKLNVPLEIITAADDIPFPFDKLTLKNYRHEILAGAHHFDGNTGDLCRLMFQSYKPGK